MAAMPIHVPDLEQAAALGFATSPAGATRSGAFVRPFEDFSKKELIKLGLKEDPARTHSCATTLPLFSGGPSRKPIRCAEAPDRLAYSLSEQVLGAFMLKKVDLWYRRGSSGPTLAISFKSAKSSIQQNINNRWEETVGEAANLHSRYPMLVLGYVVILPEMSFRHKGKPAIKIPEPIIDPTTGAPVSWVQDLETKMLAIRGRESSVEPPAMFEEVTLAVFDYSQTPPKLNAHFPSPGSPLRIEGFFDAMAERYRDRNRFI